MNLMSCHGFLKNKDSSVILKCPKIIFEYYFSKGFTYFDCSIINLVKLPTEVKQIIHAEDTDNSKKIMICSTTTPSTSNTLKNLAVNNFFILLILKRNSMIERKRQSTYSVHILNP